MADQMDGLAALGLEFFGRVSATISHALKNVLATISETAGLLGDLVELAEEGRPLKTSELRSCSDTIIDEIQRGFDTIKHLNSFAHSVDEPIKEVDLGEIVGLVVNLSRCLSYARRLNQDVAPATGLRVVTRPFFLVDLLYNGFVLAYKSVGPDSELGLAVRPENQQARIVLSGLGEVEAGSWPDERTKFVAEALGAAVALDAVDGELEFTIPGTLKTT